MVDNLWPLRLAEEKEEEDRRKKLQGKNIMAPLLHRAAIKIEETTGQKYYKGSHNKTTKENVCCSDIGVKSGMDGRSIPQYISLPGVYNIQSCSGCLLCTGN